MCHQTNLLAIPLASWWLSANGDKLHFCYLKQSRERGLTSTQGDFDCGASFQADFILNYFLSNYLKFPQISSNCLKLTLKFSISSQPGWQAGTIKAILPSCVSEARCERLRKPQNLPSHPESWPQNPFLGLWPSPFKSHGSWAKQKSLISVATFDTSGSGIHN